MRHTDEMDDFTRFYRLQKFINRLAVACLSVFIFVFVQRQAALGSANTKKWAVRIFSTEPPVLEYRRLGTAVLARQYCLICQLF